jgi:hypothetical protein
MFVLQAGVGYATVAVTLITLIFGEILPKSYAVANVIPHLAHIVATRKHHIHLFNYPAPRDIGRQVIYDLAQIPMRVQPETFARATLPVITAASSVIAPLNYLTSALSNAMLRALGTSSEQDGLVVTQPELRMILSKASQVRFQPNHVCTEHTITAADVVLCCIVGITRVHTDLSLSSLLTCAPVILLTSSSIHSPRPTTPDTCTSTRTCTYVAHIISCHTAYVYIQSGAVELYEQDMIEGVLDLQRSQVPILT